MEIDLQTLAAQVGGTLDGPADLKIRGLAGIREAEAGECTFVAKDRYLADLAGTRASAVILAEGIECSLPAIRHPHPYVAFVQALHVFARKVEDLFGEGIHPTAVVDSTARVAEGVRIGPHAVVDAGCEIGAGTAVGAGCVLMRDVTVGEHCVFYPNVTVREGCRIGSRVILHPGVVLGSDGFGFARHEGAVHKVPQIGIVVVESDVEIGANTCIDRATTGRTVIAAGSKLDNLVQVGHNVTIGERTAVSAQSGISGSSKIGRDVIIAGQVGLADHIEIGDGVRIGAKSGVSGNLAPGATVSGIPARDHREWRRSSVHIGRLARYADEITALRKRVEELEKRQGAAPAENA